MRLGCLEVDDAAAEPSDSGDADAVSTVRGASTTDGFDGRQETVD